MGGGESGLSGQPVIVPEHSTQALATLDRPTGIRDTVRRLDQPIVETLVVPLSVVMGEVFGDRPAQ